MRYEAKAIGSGSEGAQTELQEHYHKVPFLIGCSLFGAMKILDHKFIEK
jgi:20S proteasome alpha/beta subunit